MNEIENIVIFGIGAAGANIFMNLLYIYPDKNFIVIDNDKVELRNIEPGTQPYSKTDLNRPKTQALQRIAMALKKNKITAINKRINNKQNIIDIVTEPKKTLILDAFDNVASRNLFAELSTDYSIMHIGFSAILTGEAVWSNIWEPMTVSKSDNNTDVCTMALARPFIMALTSLATINIVEFINNNNKNNMYFDKKLNIKRF